MKKWQKSSPITNQQYLPGNFIAASSPKLLLFKLFSFLAYSRFLLLFLYVNYVFKFASAISSGNSVTSCLFTLWMEPVVRY